MSGQEISIISYELNDCEGNLKNLQQEWASSPEIEIGVFFKSRGHVVNTLLDSLKVADRIKKNMAILLNNTVDFFEKTGIQFSEADNTAAKDIQSIT